MNSLTKYDAARYALSVAVEVDEVKDIRDKAEGLAAYARQAKDTELVQWATEIKVRAERRAGQMLAEMPKQAGARGSGKKVESHDATPLRTLADIGITKSDSSRWQKLAAVSDQQFEHAVAAAKEVAGEVTTAAMLRAAKAYEPVKEVPAKSTPVAANSPQIAVAPLELIEEYTDLDAAHDQIAELQSALAVANIGSADTEEAQQAKTLIDDLRQEVKVLRANLKAVTTSRDALQNELAMVKRQCISLQSKLKKAA